MKIFKNTLLSTLLVAGGMGVVATPAQAADALSICNPGQPHLWTAGGANIPFNPD